MRSTAAIRAWGRRIGDLLSPRICHACEKAIGSDGHDLCPTCWDELSENISGEYCRTCGDDRGDYLLRDGRCTPCREGRSGRVRFNRFVRVGRYSGVLQQLILQFKHRYTLDDVLGRLMCSAIEGDLGSGEVSHWVPIPSHWRRRLVRGFQPTELLAARAIAGLGLKPSPVLAMRRHVPPLHVQGKVSFASRAAAMKGAFRLAPGADVDGATVALIDDVCTTGATLAEAARTLRAGGARCIVAVVLARWTAGERAMAGVDPTSSAA